MQSFVLFIALVYKAGELNRKLILKLLALCNDTTFVEKALMCMESLKTKLKEYYCCTMSWMRAVENNFYVILVHMPMATLGFKSRQLTMATLGFKSRQLTRLHSPWSCIFYFEFGLKAILC